MANCTNPIVLLISGTGASMQAVIDATRWQTLDAEVVAVFSHEAWSYGLLRAEREGLEANLHDLTDYRARGRSEREYASDLADRVAAYDPKLVILAGWKLPLDDIFFDRFHGRVVNLSAGAPGQPLAFDPYARNPVSRAYEAYTAGIAHEAHISISLLANALDASGRVIALERVPIYEFDTLIDLEERMARAEQELLVNTLGLLLREQEPCTTNAHW